MPVASDGRVDHPGGNAGAAIEIIRGFLGRLARAGRDAATRVLARQAVAGGGRRSKWLAGALALHWLMRVARMSIGERLGALRHRAGVAAVIGLCALGLVGALVLPEGDAAVASPGPSATRTTEPAGNVAVVSALAMAPAPLPAPAALPISVAELRRAIGPEAWMPVRRPIAVYNLEAPEIEGAEFSHRVATRGKHARQDVMTWTARAERSTPATRPAVHMVVERYEQAAPTFRPLYSDLAARAAEQGVAIDRMNAAREIATKFGALEVADATLATDQGQLGCLLYRRIDTIGLALSGWYCGTAQRPADRVSLACFLDRLDLVGAGQDIALKRYFASAERNRKSCAGARQSGRKLTWLDHEAPMPALKLSASKR